MKKVMFLMAVAGMFAFAACNNNTEVVEDTVATEELTEEQVEETVDTMMVEEVAEEVAE